MSRRIARLLRRAANRLDPPQWHHFVATRDDGKIRLYMDGNRLPEQGTGVQVGAQWKETA